MSPLVEIYDSFLSERIFNKIQKEISDLSIKDYKNIKSLLSWLPEEIVKEENVKKLSEKISGIKFSRLSKDTRAHIAIKYALNAPKTCIIALRHFLSPIFFIPFPIINKSLIGLGIMLGATPLTLHRE